MYNKSNISKGFMLIGEDIVEIPADQSSPKWGYSAYIWNRPYRRSDSLCYWDISYPFNIWARVVSPIETGILKDFVYQCLFWHKFVIPKYHAYCLNDLTVKGNILSFIKLLAIFCADVMSPVVVINSKNIIQCIQALFGE